ncbi:hypothetical protein ONS95_010620 [Cadophora gregata]|uniref:uncharacterized protein n=1 Tax=Cadophora gregata TaxID=51156 RepID=UPI0026DC2918|nr:uncharacterized protein ONS95_010620 [Cadophora gregata]KAK0122380.1 hypothetical protein ONS95_010620 [Cadophora gregata]KAK0127858.1 hypothetical protein ONS96_007359 [Cadophora gregata f. sp. sojae]
MPEVNTSTKAGPTQLSFFQAIFTNMKETPDVDWAVVAATAGYNSPSTARFRFGQIRRELLKKDGSAEPKSPSKPRVKKETLKNEIGSGTNLSPSKVAKSIPMRGRSKSVGVNFGRGNKGNVVMEEIAGEDEETERADDAADEMEW